MKNRIFLIIHAIFNITSPLLYLATFILFLHNNLFRHKFLLPAPFFWWVCAITVTSSILWRIIPIQIICPHCNREQFKFIDSKLIDYFFFLKCIFCEENLLKNKSILLNKNEIIKVNDDLNLNELLTKKNRFDIDDNSLTNNYKESIAKERDAIKLFIIFFIAFCVFYSLSFLK